MTYAPTLRNIKEADIARAVNTDDLDAALVPLQALAGITDGGVAAVCFSDIDFNWETAGPKEREYMLRQWLAAEWSMNEPEHN